MPGLTTSGSEVRIDTGGARTRGKAETIGQRLRRLRHERGLSQRELSSPGVSYAYISRIEAGARRPSVKALRMLAKKLGVSADYLETGSEIRDTDERELRIADAELELRLTDDPAKAEQKLERLRDEAVVAGDALAASRANIALGLAAAAAGRNAVAIERLEAGLELTPISPSARPDVFATLGRAYSATSHSDKAVEVFERSLAEVEQDAPEDLAAQIRFTTYLSFALTDLGDLDRAQTVLDAALEKADAADGRILASASLLGPRPPERPPGPAGRRARLRSARYRAASRHRRHAASRPRPPALRRHPDGAGPRRGGRPQLRPRRTALRPQSRSQSICAGLYTDQARRAVQLGDGEEATRRARAALDAVGDEYPHEKGNALWALAEGLALTGETDAADDSFRQATSLLETEGHRRDYVEAYRAWGKFLRRAGREDEALEVLERAADLAAEPVASDTRSPR